MIYHTASDISDELKISKSSVLKYLKKLHDEHYPNVIKVNGRYEFDDQAYRDIMAHFTHAETKQPEPSEADFLREQLRVKNREFERLQDSLDNEQKLNLIAENKIKELETQVKQDKQKLIEVETKSKEKPAPEHKSFWNRLLGH